MSGEAGVPWALLVEVNASILGLGAGMVLVDGFKVPTEGGIKAISTAIGGRIAGEIVFALTAVCSLAEAVTRAALIPLALLALLAAKVVRDNFDIELLSQESEHRIIAITLDGAAISGLTTVTALAAMVENCYLIFGPSASWESISSSSLTGFLCKKFGTLLDNVDANRHVFM